MAYGQPRVALDARGKIATHGKMLPMRGIWHTTECGDAKGITELEGVVNFWRGQGKGYGSQLIIDKDGNTALCANPNEITWHTENRNTGSFGIELIGFAKFSPKVWWLRQAQLKELAKWIAWLHLEYHIPIRFDVQKAWSGHRDQTKAYHLPSGHMDPGAFFPKGYVLRLANIYASTGW